MATVYIPAPLRDLCGGVSVIRVGGGTLDAVLRGVDANCPGFYARVVEDGRVRPEITVAVDGEAGGFALHEELAPGAEVTVIPAIGGGSVAAAPGWD